MDAVNTMDYYDTNDIDDDKFRNSLTFDSTLFEHTSNTLTHQDFTAAKLSSLNTIPSMTVHRSDFEDLRDFRQSDQINTLQYFDDDNKQKTNNNGPDDDESETEDVSMTYNTYDNDDSDDDTSGDDDDGAPRLSRSTLRTTDLAEVNRLREEIKYGYKTEDDEDGINDYEYGQNEADEANKERKQHKVDRKQHKEDEDDGIEQITLEENQTTKEELMEQILMAKQIPLERRKRPSENRLSKDNKVHPTCKCNKDDEKVFCIIL